MSDPTSEPAQSLEKKMVRTSPVLWILGGALALLLGALGTRALSDAADLFRSPELDAFREPRLRDLVAEREALAAPEGGRQVRLERARRDLQTQEQALATAEESWRTWLETRATLGGTSTEDREVRGRRDRLDRLRAERDQLAARAEAIRREPDPLAARLAELDQRIREATAAADAEYAAAERAYRLKVLTARLGLVVPVVALAAWLWSRRRRTRYLTLVWGYLAFAAWMAGLGIYPYLPHYGGYAPLAAGAVLTIWLSISLVRYFNRRAPARRRRLVDRAIAAHRCPGCGCDYLVGREVGLTLGLTRKAPARSFDRAALHPRACPACGLPLFGACPACGAEQVVHLDHCAACGAAWTGPATA